MGAKSFDCPNCGAPIDYDGSGTPTIRCPYCNTSVIVPEELRPHKPHSTTTVPVKPVVTVSFESREKPKPAHAGSYGWLLVIVVVVVALLIIGVSVLPGMIANQAISEGVSQVQKVASSGSTNKPEPTATTLPSPTPTPAAGMAVLTIGSKGIGPGLLNDARYIAVDGSGIVYVADYDGGRVQAFDSTGKYQRQWNIGGSNTIIYGMAANHAGQVFIALENGIARYEGATGSLLDTLASPNGGEFGDLSATVDGGLAGVWYESRWGIITSLEGHRDDLVMFNAKGKITKTIPSLISGQTENLALDTLIAVDGTGNIYALSEESAAVFKFSPDGKFINRFGSEGEQPDQFNSPRAVAVDGQGRVFVGGSRKVWIFSPDGRFIDSFPTAIFIDGMAFDEQGGLWTVSRDQVNKFQIKVK